MLPSKRTLTAFVLASASVLAIAILILQNRDDEERATRLEKRMKELSELVESSPRVEERRTIVERRVPVPMPAPPLAAAEAQAEPEALAEVERVEGGEEPEPPATQDKVAYAQSVFDNEPRDVGWATQTKNALNAALGQHLGSSTLAALECKSALCRAEVAHTNDAERRQFMDGVVGNSHDVWPGPMAIYQVETADDGRVVQNLYFARQGTRLPRL